MAREGGGEGEVRNKPIPKPPELRGRLEELAIEGHWRWPSGSGRVSLLGSTPVDELGLRYREIDMSRISNCPQTAENRLQSRGVGMV